jgi:DNA-dependent RNA polymerase auxiliary subunit epsilon
MIVGTTTEWNLLRRRKRIVGELRQTLCSELMRGSIVLSSRKCGRSQCICEREGKRHPRTSLSVNLRGKTNSIYLDAEREGVARTGIEAYVRLWALLEELTEVNLALLAYRGQSGGKGVRRRHGDNRR